MGPASRAAQRQAADAAEFFRSVAEEVSAERDRQAALRPELEFEDVAAPKRLAPYAAALVAAVTTDGAEIATGRLILLYDPAGQPGWVGPFRIVAQIQAEVDAEIAVDPLLGSVGWSWLTEALDAWDARYDAPSGTVTRVVTEGFGAKRDDPAATEFELRASWSPVELAGEPAQPGLAGGPGGRPPGPADLAGGPGRRGSGASPGPAPRPPGPADLAGGSGGRPPGPALAPHVAAWCDALCAAAGLAPAPGVSALPPPGGAWRARPSRGARAHADGSASNSASNSASRHSAGGDSHDRGRTDSTGRTNHEDLRPGDVR
jgi:Protein of unknown function (DUF3000)